MNYAAFRAYLTNFLWRQNDTDLVANIDNLILMANHELNRVLNIERRNVTTVINPTSPDFNLPANFRHMRSLNDLKVTPGRVKSFSVATLEHVYERRVQTNGNVFVPIYAVDQTAQQPILRLVGPYTADNPGELLLAYRSNVPNFAVTNASWLATDFLDLYTYTVLSHCAPYLREDERVELWLAKKSEAIAAAIDENEREIKFGGSPLTMKPHHPVPQQRRRF
jgi:hypothetical protein